MSSKWLDYVQISQQQDTIAAIYSQSAEIRGMENARKEQQLNDLLYEFFTSASTDKDINISSIGTIRYFLSEKVESIISQYNHYADVFEPRASFLTKMLFVSGAFALISTLVLASVEMSDKFQFLMTLIVISAILLFVPIKFAIKTMIYKQSYHSERKAWYQKAYEQLFKLWYEKWPQLNGFEIIQKTYIDLITADLFEDLYSRDQSRAMYAMDNVYNLIFRMSTDWDYTYPLHRDWVKNLPNRPQALMYIDFETLKLYDEYRSQKQQ